MPGSAASRDRGPPPPPTQPERTEQTRRALEDEDMPLDEQRRREEDEEQAKKDAEDEAARQASEEADQEILDESGWLERVGQTFHVGFEDDSWEVLKVQSATVKTTNGRAKLRVVLVDETGEIAYEGTADYLDFREISGTGTKDDPIDAETPEDVGIVAGQTEAGNYKQGHLKGQGLDLTIETARGGTRRSATEEQRLLVRAITKAPRRTRRAEELRKVPKLAGQIFLLFFAVFLVFPPALFAWDYLGNLFSLLNSAFGYGDFAFAYEMTRFEYGHREISWFNHIIGAFWGGVLAGVIVGIGKVIGSYFR